MSSHVDSVSSTATDADTESPTDPEAGSQSTVAALRQTARRGGHRSFDIDPGSDRSVFLGWALGGAMVVVGLAWALSQWGVGGEVADNAPVDAGLTVDGLVLNDIQLEIDDVLTEADVAGDVTGLVNRQGVVSLDGTVTSDELAGSLVTAVGSVSGVNSVNSQLEVEVPPEPDPEPEPEPAPEPVEQVTINEELSLDPVTFETNSATITSEGQDVLDEALAYLSDNTDVEVEIAGHTDSVAEDGFNMRLSQDRANVVRDYLIENGIAGERLTAIGYGETQPVASNDTEAGKARNRRIEFVILDP